MKLYNYPDRKIWPEICARPSLSAGNLEQTIGEILSAVKREGDAALRRFARKWDGKAPEEFRVSRQEIAEAAEMVPEDLKAAITLAAENIRAFHAAQRAEEPRVETMPGLTCWQKSLPLERVGLYIPGGSAPLFSTILMLAIPAQIAGCREIILCSPSNSAGGWHPAMLYTAGLLGLNQLYKIGGAQAIAAMAFGTESIPKVEKIFGPGNQYVTAAKQLVSREGVAIDLPAGPSEVLVIADDSAYPDFIAADLLAQAEHGPDSQVVLVCNNPDLIPAVRAALEKQLAELPRAEVARRALQNSRMVILPNLSDAFDFSNTYAPEHLILLLREPERWLDHIRHAGSVFVGHHTPESLGDYASGTNHTLPTNGYARAFSGVSLESFLKKITFQQATPAALRQIGPAVETMADAEDLLGHARAVRIRLTKSGKDADENI